jgi:hypothetical protein
VVFHARPASGGWSAAECVAHLTLTTAGMLPRIDAALDAGRPGVADEHRYRRGVVGSLLARSSDPGEPERGAEARAGGRLVDGS